MKLKVVFLFLLIALLSACYPVCEQVSVGAVVADRRYHAPYVTYTRVPHTTCTKVGKSNVCTTWYSSVPVHHSEWWEIGARYNDVIYWRPTNRETYETAKDGDGISIDVCRNEMPR